MKIITSPNEMQLWALETRAQGKTISLVPTMGALHAGHLSLFSAASGSADRLVLSIFVNPAQFGVGEDLDEYPRDRDEDLTKAKACGVDLVFLPETKDIYPKKFQTYVDVAELGKRLCGASRPGHFRGVATIVLKLFNMVQPHIAYFGEKDFQQLRVIQQMISDLNLPVKIRSVPIVREADGLAMSSRNRYLSPEERKAALAISRSLQKTKEMVASKKCDASSLLKRVEAVLLESGKIRIDYIKLSDPETLEDLSTFRIPALLAIACFVGKTRLIDNCLLQ